MHAVEGTSSLTRLKFYYSDLVVMHVVLDNVNIDTHDKPSRVSQIILDG